MPSRVCRLRGLPFSATSEEIAEWFSDYTLDEVYICKRDGRATGEAYVVFCDATQASSAMETRDRHPLGHRYIEIFEASEADLAAVKRALEDPALQGCVVRLRGLPYTATAEDVAHFLEGVQLAKADDAIVLTTTEDGRAAGECYVELADAAAHSLAMTRHKELMGTRYIEVFHSTKVDKLHAQQAELGRWGVQAQHPGLAMPHGVRHGMQPAAPHRMQPAMPRGMHPSAPRGVQPPVRHMQPVMPRDIQPAMPRETQLAVLAAAAAAGSRVTCEVGQLASTLQGTHLNGSVASSAMPPMQQQQQQQLYLPAYPQSHMLPPIQTVSMPLTTRGSLLDSSSSSSNSSSSNRVSNSSSVPSMGSSTLSVPSVIAAPAPGTDVLYYQASIPAASATVTQPGGAVMSPAAAYGNMMLYAPAPAPVQATTQQQQQQPSHVYYVPVQQGAMQGPTLSAYAMPAPMPGAYGMPAPVYSMPPSYLAAAAADAAEAPAPVYSVLPSYPAATAAEVPTVVQTSQPRPMLVGGGQWMPAPAHCPAPSWPASTAAAGYASLAVPACGMGAV